MMYTKGIQHLTEQAVEDRRYLHRYPELSWEEFETSKFVRNRLGKLNIDILDFEPPSVVGFLKGTEGKKTIALRADIDALPLVEEGGKEYISKNPGVTHACGHDGHTAVLLAVAEWMSENRMEIKPNIKFIFQTAEETAPSGAEYLIHHGVLDDVDAIFGIHLWQPLEKGKIGLVHGPMMAAGNDFEITIEGKGGHGSMPHVTVDPIYIASHIIQGLQAITSRYTNPIESKVISLGQIEAGTTYNIIPNTAVLRGTVRAFSIEGFAYTKTKIRQIIEGICASFDAAGKIRYTDEGTPPLINDTMQSKFVEKVIRDSFGDDVFTEPEPVMSGEDFSHYLLRKPGAFIFVGMKGEISAYPHHHPKFDIDEEVFPAAIELLVNIVKNFK